MHPSSLSRSALAECLGPRCLGTARRIHSNGFTLIELLVVLAIVALLLTIAVPRYFQSIDIARETVLIENLRVLRESVDRFYGDAGRYPETLQELVSRRYLKAVPIDPVSESATTWIIVPADEKTGEGVANVLSGAPGRSRNGTMYNQL